MEAAGIRLRWHEVEAEFGLWVPARPNDVLDTLDEEEYRRTDERIPYFAVLWPAGEALARHVLDAEDLDGREVLDLGCGVGAAGLAALYRGARVTFLDWEPRALELVSASAERLGLEPALLVSGDWRDPVEAGPFDLVLAADVLYEARNIAPVATFLAAHLAPDGEAWLADPRRPEAEALPAALEEAGLDLHAAGRLPCPTRDVHLELRRVRRSRTVL
jgi:predicted nicotinamide N-methyase